MESVVIVSTARTPIGRLNGAYANVAATELGGVAIRAAIERAGIDPASVDECLVGNVISAGLGQAPARQAALAGGLPMSVGATLINKVCGSSLKGVMLATALIRAGEAATLVVAGMESMSRGPYILPQARTGYRLGNGEIVDATIHDGLWCPFEQHHMGNAAEWIARTFRVTREQQDTYALQSHQRAVAAQDAGRFAPELSPVTVPAAKGQPSIITTDEGPRRATSLPALARLRPAFDPQGSVTVGNAPGISDGATALVVMSESRAAALGLTPLARVLSMAQACVPPLEVLTATTFAIRRLLDRTQTTIDDYDLFEINEAFAAQMIANIRELGLDPDRVNVHGGSIAIGHPIGASGARIVMTLIHALKQRGGQRGIASICIGGGEAAALAIEVF